MNNRFFLLLLLGVSLCFTSACGGDDEDDDMESGPDLTTRIVGSYDGTYFERTDGNFGPSYNGRAFTSVSKIDNNTVRIANGVSIDAVFEVTMENETNFSAEGVDKPVLAGRDITVEGSLTPGATSAEDVLTLVATDAVNTQFRITFTGTRRQ